MNLIPNVKSLKIKQGYLATKAIFYDNLQCDSRVISALSDLPFNKTGVNLKINIKGKNGEGYELLIEENQIVITSDSVAGAFYAVQTLKQIFKEEKIPCLHIIDKPDFEYRGFYHDVTRGKIPKVETIKALIDKMAFYKLNSLQLYVEHTFEFEECKELNEKTGCLTKDEIEEIDRYCYEHFIEFIPSIATFGHMYEILQQDKYCHLRVLNDFEEAENFWHSRMQHHTIDPLQEESIELVKSLINQYVPHFKSEYFNICCDETFDLKKYEAEGYDVGKLYVDFVKKIINYVSLNDKKIMMWADILLQHPEVIDELPEDTYFLNWNYSSDPSEENIMQFSKLRRKQIVCPGTSTWNRLCENIAVEERNISLMAEYGYKHGAVGLLNTNWGDWGNPCSIELAMYGMVLGAEKSWSVNTEINNAFYGKVNKILYESENGTQNIKALSDLHGHINWGIFCDNYFKHKYKTDANYRMAIFSDIKGIQQEYLNFVKEIGKEEWKNNEYKNEILISAEGICVIAELTAKLFKIELERVTNTEEWIKKYSDSWLGKNKPSELYRIKEMFYYCEAEY